MSREIKFRALKDDMSNCSFVYGQLVYDAIGQPRITAVDRSGQGLVFHTCLRNTESQYTGLKDKNGFDCYEGDIIVNKDGDKRQIMWIWAGFEMRLMNGEKDSNNTTWYFDFEVVGNIYETP